MAQPLQSTGQQGHAIPEYSKETVDGWLMFIGKSIEDVTLIVLTLLMVLGFVLFVLGLSKYMAQARESAMGGGGGGAGSNEGVTMMIVGALFGAGDAVALLLIMVVSSH